jgi:ornithine carbamoyltransferase
MAAAAPKLHVINALSDEEHPCQALADMMTLQEHWGSLLGRRIAFVGDGNNVATSLAHATALLGIGFHIASPRGYELPSQVVETARRVAADGAAFVCLPTHARRFRESMRFTPMCGRRWDRNGKPNAAGRISHRTR